MSRRKRPPDKRIMSKGSARESVRVGDISDVKGNVNIAGRNIHQKITTGLTGTEIKQLFDTVYNRIETRPDTSTSKKEDLKADVQQIQLIVTEAAQKDKKVDETLLSRHFRNIARMAPDIVDVIVATVAHPLAGLGALVKKIAQKAKEEAE